MKQLSYANRPTLKKNVSIYMIITESKLCLQINLLEKVIMSYIRKYGQKEEQRVDADSQLVNFYMKNNCECIQHNHP